MQCCIKTTLQPAQLRRAAVTSIQGQGWIATPCPYMLQMKVQGVVTSAVLQDWAPRHGKDLTRAALAGCSYKREGLK